MDAVAALPASAAPGRIHFDHRRLLVPRHHAGRGDADHRHGGDERLPQGTARQDPRPQRPSAGAAAGIAADRLPGGGRAAVQASTASGSRCRSSRARRWRRRRSTPPACWCAASAARTSPGSPRSPSNIKQGTLEGFDQGQGGGDRPAARRSAHACAPATASRWSRRAARSRRWAPRRASRSTRSRRCSRSACRNTTPPSCSCRSPRRRPISTATTTSPRSRSTPTIPTRSRGSGSSSPRPPSARSS